MAPSASSASSASSADVATEPEGGPFDLSITFHPDVSGKLGWVKLPEAVPLWMFGDKGAAWLELRETKEAWEVEVQDANLARAKLDDTAIELDATSACGEALRAAALKGKPKRLLLSFTQPITTTVVGCLRSLAAPRLYLTGCLYRPHRKDACPGDEELAALAADDDVRARVRGLALSIRDPASLENLARFPSLEALALQGGEGAKEVALAASLPFDGLPNVRFLDVEMPYASTEWFGAAPARFAAHLETLRGNVELWTPLPAPCALRRVGLGWVDERTLPALAACTSLRELSTDTTRFEDAALLSPFEGLEVLHLRHWAATNLAPLGPLRRLRTLSVPGTKAKDFEVLASLSSLTEVDLSFAEISSLTPLAGLTGLVSLDLSFSTASDLTPIAGLKSLEALDVADTKVTSIDVVRGLRALKELSIAKTAVSDLSPIAGLPELARVMLYESNVTDATPLLTLPKLARANISHLSLPQDQRDALKAKLGHELYD